MWRIAVVEYRYEILRTLAWIAPLRTDQLRRIIAPMYDPRNFRRLLGILERDQMITCVDYFYAGGQGHRDLAKRRPPKPVGKVWSLSPRGWGEIKRDDTLPAIPAKVRLNVLEHDLMTSELITKIIEWTRPILSSIFLDHEVRLDDTRRRPIADAMLSVRYHHRPERRDEGFVPWKSFPPQPGEGVRLYAIETDRDTEETAIIHDKANNYQRVRSDPTFYARYGGGFPTIMAIVPSPRRLQDWHQGWTRNWPTGQWMITTDADLQRDQWLHFAQGRERLSTFVDGWQPGQDVPKGMEAPIPPSAGPQKPRIIGLPDI
jgi:hypothetical protein